MAGDLQREEKSRGLRGPWWVGEEHRSVQGGPGAKPQGRGGGEPAQLLPGGWKGTVYGPGKEQLSRCPSASPAPLAQEDTYLRCCLSPAPRGTWPPPLPAGSSQGRPEPCSRHAHAVPSACLESPCSGPRSGQPPNPGLPAPIPAWGPHSLGVGGSWGAVPLTPLRGSEAGQDPSSPPLQAGSGGLIPLGLLVCARPREDWRDALGGSRCQWRGPAGRSQRSWGRGAQGAAGRRRGAVKPGWGLRGAPLVPPHPHPHPRTQVAGWRGELRGPERWAESPLPEPPLAPRPAPHCPSALARDTFAVRQRLASSCISSLVLNVRVWALSRLAFTQKTEFTNCLSF